MDLNKWIFAIDRGGTFTDIVAFSPEGKFHVIKLLSQSILYKDSISIGLRKILCEEKSFESIFCIKLGTTVGTNALLERKGTEIALVTTKGFGDVLEIAYQDRPYIFQLNIEKCLPLYKDVVEISERVDASGGILKDIEEEDIRIQLKSLKDKGIQSIAIVLMHSWKNAIHEKKIAQIARKMKFEHISCSHEVMPLIKIVGRGRTTTLDAYITPILQEYLRSVQKETGNIPLKCMQSNGGIVDVKLFSGKNAILSGPAGGVIGFSHIAQLLGHPKVIGFDMGGTSTDVSRFDGEYEKIFEAKLANFEFQADMLHVETVASGGGSILKFDGERMSVGPESAGAQPGPSCYRNDGPLTVTDANLMLGRIVPEFFPKVFGKEGNQSLDADVVLKKFQDLSRNIQGIIDSPERVADSYIQIANDHMSRAIQKISVARGFNLEDYVLICFGGAGAQHACGISKLLGISEIVIPHFAGVLSAYGIALANIVRTSAKSILKPLLAHELPHLEKELEKMSAPLLEEVLKEGVKKEDLFTRFYADIRPKGSETSENVSWGKCLEMIKEFQEKYQKHYGIEVFTKELEISSLRVEVIGVPKKPKLSKSTFTSRQIEEKEAEDFEHKAYFGDKFYSTPIFMKEKISPGEYLNGPAIFIDKNSTIVVEPGFQAKMDGYHNILISCKTPSKISADMECTPMMLEIFHNIFRHIAEQMGVTLLNTAHSTNIKERMDFSCAVFDPYGNLVANAPHIPVHLGAMGETVRHILNKYRENIYPGDVFVSNNPYAGGSHLPDITVVTPVFTKENNWLGFVASRGHHADIGGITPGSMPAFSNFLDEEGIVLNNIKLVEKGNFQEEKIKKILQSTPFPARNLKERFSDLYAQIAANKKGADELLKCMNQYGFSFVLKYMDYTRKNAANAMRKALGKFLCGKSMVKKSFCDYLDDGSRISVTIVIERGENPPHSHQATIDFSGTSEQVPGNLNAPPAVTKAAVLYVLRTLIQEDIPLNSGCLEPIKIYIPPKTILNPEKGLAVAGGNVETSQRIVDVMYGALEVVAASQGTMNNLSFGTDHFGYYETICGGSGAGPNFHGVSAVHTHMTNTRITDPEILEFRHPEVRLKEFSIRKNSGGKGTFQGGNGVIRRLEFLEDRKLTILSERRGIPPYGLCGGKPGKRGMNTITDQNGWEKAIPAKIATTIKPGETLNIYTPGGGGYGGIAEK